MKPTRNLYGIHNDFCGVGGGLRRGCILIRNRDGVGWGGVGWGGVGWGGVGWGGDDDFP